MQPQHTPANKPQFEVVSIRPNNSGRPGNIGFLPDGYRGENVSMVRLILQAYGLTQQYQLLGLPKWAQSAHYDITARVRESDVPSIKKLGFAQLSTMFQPVLEDRFSLYCHREKRFLPAYTLEVSTKDTHLKNLQTVDHSKTVQVGKASVQSGALLQTRDGRIVARAVKIQQLVSLLTDEISTYVIDGTGLMGEYDFEMQLPPMPEHSSFTATDDTGPMHSPDQIDPVEQIQDGLSQIGLKLVPAKAELPVLVIDQLTPPSPN